MVIFHVFKNKPRFIPNRSFIDFEESYHMLTAGNLSPPSQRRDDRQPRRCMLLPQMMMMSSQVLRRRNVLNNRKFTFSSCMRAAPGADAYDHLFYTQYFNRRKEVINHRLPARCDLILDAPDVCDNFC
jgi:hypothetical protein